MCKNVRLSLAYNVIDQATDLTSVTEINKLGTNRVTHGTTFLPTTSRDLHGILILHSAILEL
jgi:hypothetical protein